MAKLAHQKLSPQYVKMVRVGICQTNDRTKEKNMETIQEVQTYLKREMSGGMLHRTDTPERMMLDVLDGLAAKCQSVEEFVEKAQQIPVTGAGIEQVDIANEYREIVLEAIQS